MAHKLYYNLGKLNEGGFPTFIGFGHQNPEIGFDGTRTPLAQSAGTVFLDCNCDGTVADECPVLVLMLRGAVAIKGHSEMLYSDKLRERIFGSRPTQ